MSFKNAFSSLISLVFTCGVVLAQQTPPAPTAPATAPLPPPAFSLFVSSGGFLGVHAEDINKENMSKYNLREVRGVGITQVVNDSPAAKAGLRKDDVIVRFEGDSVTSVRKLTRLISEVAADQTVRLTISRGGSDQEVSVTIGKRDSGFQGLQRLEGLKGLDGKLKDLQGRVWKFEGQARGADNFVFAFGNHRRIGVSTMQLTKQLADYFGIADGKGVLVTSVTADSPAARVGIKAGDIITSVEGEKIEGAGDISRAINKKKEGDVTLTVVRDRNQRTFTLTPQEAPQVQGAPRMSGRQIVVPRIELGTLPAVNVTVPRIQLPVIPEIRVNVGERVVLPRVIRSRSNQPI